MLMRQALRSSKGFDINCLNAQSVKHSFSMNLPKKKETAFQGIDTIHKSS